VFVSACRGSCWRSVLQDHVRGIARLSAACDCHQAARSVPLVALSPNSPKSLSCDLSGAGFKKLSILVWLCLAASKQFLMLKLSSHVRRLMTLIPGRAQVTSRNLHRHFALVVEIGP